MSRIKPAATTVVIKSTEEADTVLARIAAHKRRIELIDLSAARRSMRSKPGPPPKPNPSSRKSPGLNSPCSAMRTMRATSCSVGAKACN